MPSPRRLSALLFGLLFLQLNLLGNGGSCRVHYRETNGVGTTAMRMPGSAHDDARSPHDACGAERAPGDCASMPSCAAVLGTPVSGVIVIGNVPVAQAIDEPVAIHSQPAAAPDAPPPRG